MNDNNVDDVFDRSDEEDHDLLTFGEAGLRIKEELDELAERRKDMSEGPERDELDRRVERLHDAGRRVAAAHGESFFSYDPKE